MKQVRILQHVACEGPGLIAESLRDADLAGSVVRLDRGEALEPSIDRLAGLVVMGGPMGVDDLDAFPPLRDELALIERALNAGVAVLGVCLGCQLLAKVLGAPVYPGPRKEIGWLPVELTEAGRRSPWFADLPDRFTPLIWHGDVFDPPRGAVNLARSEYAACQAFTFGDNALGLLFHLEATEDQTRTMARTFTDELDELGLIPADLTVPSSNHLPAAHRLGRQIFGRWAHTCHRNQASRITF